MNQPSPSEVRRPWALVAVLTVAMTINFFDRGNLAVAAPVLAPELNLSPWSLGLLLSAFYWTYAVCQIGAGWLVDRIDVRWVYTAGFIVWSLATLAMGVVDTFAGLLCLRLILGLGESVAYPASSRILVAAFPENRRGLANSLIDLGARLGPALGTLCGGLLVAGMGWRGLFLLSGGAGLLWLVPWMFLAPGVPTPSAARLGGNQPGWAALLGKRAVWGTCGGLCGANFARYFL